MEACFCEMVNIISPGATRWKWYCR